MDEQEWLAQRFEAHRDRLRALAYRMLGSLSKADDAVQESWLRLSRSDAADIENLAGWLTTVVSRVCLDMLRSRRSRPEEPVGVRVPQPIVSPEDGMDPEHQALLAVLDPDCVLRADVGPAGASKVVHGARDVAEQAVLFSSRAPLARAALVNGAAGLVVSRDDRLLSVMGFTVARDRIVAIDILADAESLGRLDVAIPDVGR